MKNFDSDELMIISIYNRDSRKDTIAEIYDMRRYLEDDETDLKDLTASVIRKLEAMSDEEYFSMINSCD